MKIDIDNGPTHTIIFPDQHLGSVVRSACSTIKVDTGHRVRQVGGLENNPDWSHFTEQFVVTTSVEEKIARAVEGSNGHSSFPVELTQKEIERMDRFFVSQLESSLMRAPMAIRASSVDLSQLVELFDEAMLAIGKIPRKRYQPF